MRYRVSGPNSAGKGMTAHPPIAARSMTWLAMPCPISAHSGSDDQPIKDPTYPVTDRAPGRAVLAASLSPRRGHAVALHRVTVYLLHGRLPLLAVQTCGAKSSENAFAPMSLLGNPKRSTRSEAMTVLLGSPWIEVRYNPFIHAKVYVAMSRREADSFGLFGSGNLTAASFQRNIEVAMMLLRRWTRQNAPART